MIVENATPSFRSSFLSLQHFPSIPYVVPFVSTLPLSLGTSFISFQPLLPVRCCVPSFKVVHFVMSFLPFQLNVCHFFPFVSTLPFRSVIPSVSTLSFRSVVTFVQLFPFIRYFLLVSPLPFHLLLPSFPFNSFLSFVLAFYSLQSTLRFTSDLSSVIAFYALPSLFRFISGFLCVTVFLLFHVWPFIHYFLPFVSSGYLRPLEWLQVAANGCKWPQDHLL